MYNPQHASIPRTSLYVLLPLVQYIVQRQPVVSLWRKQSNAYIAVIVFCRVALRLSRIECHRLPAGGMFLYASSSVHTIGSTSFLNNMADDDGGKRLSYLCKQCQYVHRVQRR